MKPTQFPWKWLLFGLLAVLLSSIAVFPFLIGDTSRFSDLVASELSRWTGGQVKFTGPVRVSFFPDISVRGELEVQDSARLPLVKSMTVKEAKISLDLVDLLRGDVTIDSLRLLKPRIALREGTPTADIPEQAAEATISAFLADAPVRALHVRKGRIRLGRGRGSVKEVYAHLDVGEDGGAVSGFGSFVLRDATIRYTVETGSPSMTVAAQSMPMRLTLDSKPLRAKISGTASYDTEFKFDGEMQAEIDDLRKFLKWTGVRLPEGDSLKAFTATGSFHLSGPSLVFNDGTFALDGNKAIGLLAVKTAPSRPRLEGTLAFGRLVLDPYLGINAPRTRVGDPPSERERSLLDGVLAQYVDTDLRISAAEIQAGTLKLGRGGFTLTAKNGAVSSEIGELELCGGSAEGRVSLDLAEATKPMDVVADLTDISFDSCLGAFGMHRSRERNRGAEGRAVDRWRHAGGFRHTVYRQPRAHAEGRFGAGRFRPPARCHDTP